MHLQSNEPQTSQPHFPFPGCGGRHRILDEESNANVGQAAPTELLPFLLSVHAKCLRQGPGSGHSQQE